MLSVIIPAYNEEKCVAETVRSFNKTLEKNKIDHEILVVNDHSTDRTVQVLENLKKEIKELRYVNNESTRGVGTAIIKGLRRFKGDYVTLVMADMSDDPRDLITYYRKIKEGYDCVFGSRFIKGGRVVNYPLHKLFFNRLCNNTIRVLFWIKYNDITNPFKLYTRETIMGLEPFISKHFNLGVEIPFKAIVRGYTYTVVPNIWRARTKGTAKFDVKQMGNRYFFIILYCLIEKILTKGDYRKNYIKRQ